MKPVAVLGASGFIGCRLCEMMHLGNLALVRPVVRRGASLAPLSRLRLDAHVADACDPQALTSAFAGCDSVVHAVAGSPEVIIGSLEPVYRAAQQAGVRRLIYLSSASVHGQNPSPSTTEESPLCDRQPLPYNNAKVRAEQTLRLLRDRGKVELVILRPGIVFGPRSFWVADFAERLLGGTAYLIDDGLGICNSIYVDNLIHGIRLALAAPGVDGQALFLGDRETVTWGELYRPIADYFSVKLDQLPRIRPLTPAQWRQRQKPARHSGIVHALASCLPLNLRKALSVAITPARKPQPQRSPWETKTISSLEPTLEMSLLYTCSHKLPNDKAKRLLAYEPIVAFSEGCRRSVEWLAFAGYEVPPERRPEMSE